MDDAGVTDNRRLGDGRTDVEDHPRLSVRDILAGSDHRRHQCFDQEHFTRTDAHDDILGGFPLRSAATAGLDEKRPILPPDALGAGLAQQSRQQGRCGLGVVEAAVRDRTDELASARNGGVRCVIAHSENLAAKIGIPTALEENGGRLVRDQSAPSDENPSPRGAEVDGDVQSAESFFPSQFHCRCSFVPKSDEAGIGRGSALSAFSALDSDSANSADSA